MTYLELLSWARKGLAAEKEELHRMQCKTVALNCLTKDGGGDIIDDTQEKIEAIEVKERILDDLERIHNGKY